MLWEKSDVQYRKWIFKNILIIAVPICCIILHNKMHFIQRLQIDRYLEIFEEMVPAPSTNKVCAFLRKPRSTWLDLLSMT